MEEMPARRNQSFRRKLSSPALFSAWRVPGTLGRWEKTEVKGVSRRADRHVAVENRG